MGPQGEKASSIITAQVLLQLIIFTPSIQLIWVKKKSKENAHLSHFAYDKKRVCELLVNPEVLSVRIGTFR